MIEGKRISESDRDEAATHDEGTYTQDHVAISLHSFICITHDVSDNNLAILYDCNRVTLKAQFYGHNNSWYRFKIICTILCAKCYRYIG